MLTFLRAGKTRTAGSLTAPPWRRPSRHLSATALVLLTIGAAVGRLRHLRRCRPETGAAPQSPHFSCRNAATSSSFCDRPELRAEAERRVAEHAARLGSAVLASARLTTASLRADLENAKACSRRLESNLAALRRRLGEPIGADVMADEVGCPSMLATGAANPRLVEFEQHLAEVEDALARRTEELEAARQINRELTRDV